MRSFVCFFYGNAVLSAQMGPVVAPLVPSSGDPPISDDARCVLCTVKVTEVGECAAKG